jgi:UDP:flavonoid glycosyltransferase YjiC (YdhE family)
VVYLYVGRYGQDDLDWSRLERLADRGIHFAAYDPAPGSGPSNLHVVPSPDWPGGDLIASTDAVVAKAGYSTVCEAMASGTPMIYPPRRGFAEFRSLDRALRSWAGGFPISTRDFQGFRLEAALERALARRAGPPPFPADGAARVARHLARVCRDPAVSLDLTEALK